MVFEIGRLCIKIAGRDAGKQALVVDILENNFVLIDGLTRRRKCNIMHLEPLDKVLKITKGADTAAVQKALKAEGFDIPEKKQTKEKKESVPRPKKQKVKREKQVKKKKVSKGNEEVKKASAPAKKVEVKKEEKPDKVETKKEVKTEKPAESKPELKKK